MPSLLKLYLFAFLLIYSVVACKKSEKQSESMEIQLPQNDAAVLSDLFGSFNQVDTHYDDQFFYIESNGLPAHLMMIGITNWQQQVPIQQDYSGKNSWAIPLHPEIAEQPLSTKENFMKGAIAIAVNGIPIFNPLNNRGEDAKAIGELDQWGGHCGRADDYHYHLPPTHLQEIVGDNHPIAYALDGFPVYGETTEELDECLGRFTTRNTYQYHAVPEYPYLIAAMKGKVKLNPRTKAPENEISPQAKTTPIRKDLRPLPGAEIIDFKRISEHQFELTYRLSQQEHVIQYKLSDNGTYDFDFIHPDGSRETASYPIQ
ncbi:MAG: YHYH protein [Saprospiraceae bacterium]|nr:YHYH protein [Saprospiraceae bacterium]